MQRGWGIAGPVVCALVLVGCTGSTGAPSDPADEAQASAAAEPTMEPIAAVEDLAGTAWRGDDSDGDRHTLTFGDERVTHDSYGTKQEITWTVVGDTVAFRISFAPGDALDFAATLDAVAQTMTADGVDPTDPDDQLTIELERIR